jgi:isoamylase
VPAPCAPAGSATSPPFLALFDAHWQHVVFALPPAGYGQRWRVVVDTAAAPREGGPLVGPGDTVKAEARPVVLLTRRHHDPAAGRVRA